MAGPAKRVTSRSVRPKFNVFSLLDHLTGTYAKGKYGLWYLNGGFSPLMAFGGRGNTFKSAFSGTCVATVSIRYRFGYSEFYDSEISLEVERIVDYIKAAMTNNFIGDPKSFNVHSLNELYHNDDTTWNHIEAGDMYGDTWWKDHVRDEVESRHKAKGRALRQTPYKEMDGSYRTMPSPWVFNVDSLSEMSFTKQAIEEEKTAITDTKRTTDALTASRIKARLMKEMPVVASRGSMYFGLVAHADDDLKLEKYAASTKKLEGLKGNLKFKDVPGRQFTFLPNNCFLAIAIGNGLGDDKYPLYKHPDQSERIKEKTDIRIIKFAQLRGKNGPTGETLDIVFSQKEGMLVGLTEYHYLSATLKGWGLTSSGIGGATKQLDLYPEVKFTRHNVRKFLREDRKFARAMSITAACAYMFANWFHLERNLACTMTELREKLTEKGYDWDHILAETVEYWYFEDQEKSIGMRTVTAMSLLKVFAGEEDYDFLKSKSK